MDIILFGMQGSGKGTQGKILAERYALRRFEMGSELRAMAAAQTPLGQKINEALSGGHLVDESIVMEVVEAFLAKAPLGSRLLFDGIPRTLSQSKRFMGILRSHGRDAFALLIRLGEEEAVSRLTRRRVCSQCKETYPAFYEGSRCSQCGGSLVSRQDDENLDSIRRRLDSYEKETAPVIDSFAQRDRLIEVDGEQPIADVTQEMVEKAGYLFD